MSRQVRKDIDGYSLGIDIVESETRTMEKSRTIYISLPESRNPERPVGGINFRHSRSWELVYKSRKTESYDNGLFTSRELVEPLPPVDKHLAEAVNEAVCKLNNTREREAELQRDIHAALDAVKEVHEGDT